MRLFLWILVFIAGIVVIILLTPVIKVELGYYFDRALNVKYVLGTEQFTSFEKPLYPPNTDFSIVIPKLGATAKIIDGVNPVDPNSYLPALHEGIAHAEGSGYPGSANLYLIAHSSDAFYNVSDYNAVFFLIGNLETGDEIDVFYLGSLVKYRVSEKRVLSNDLVNYAQVPYPGERALILQTDYPPGTPLQRLLVYAKQVD